MALGKEKGHAVVQRVHRLSSSCHWVSVQSLMRTEATENNITFHPWGQSPQ